MFPATVYLSPSPSPKRLPRTSSVPPERLLFGTKLITPAMASDPYWAEAPSRRTSTWLTAMAGKVAMSGACAPSATPLPPKRTITADRCRLLPLTRTSVWSGARLRMLAGREMVAASLIGSEVTLYDGTTLRKRVLRSVSPCRARSVTGTTSIGTIDSAAVRE